MTKAYINYPNPHIRAYSDLNSAQIGKHSKESQRIIRIDLNSLSVELSRFAHKYYEFSSDKARNDMWLEIDLNDHKFESEVLKYIQLQIGQHYKPLAPSRITIQEA